MGGNATTVVNLGAYAGSQKSNAPVAHGSGGIAPYLQAPMSHSELVFGSGRNLGTTYREVILQPHSHHYGATDRSAAGSHAYGGTDLPANQHFHPPG